MSGQHVDIQSWQVGMLAWQPGMSAWQKGMSNNRFDILLTLLDISESGK
jgi:hypothetical protein